jgi:hypothetical protein
MEEPLRAIADGGDMVVGPLKPTGGVRGAAWPCLRCASSWAEPCRARLESRGTSVVLLGTATAPQLVLDLAPNQHGPGLVDHVVDEADVIPPNMGGRGARGTSPRGKGQVVEGVGRRVLVGVRTEKEVGQLFERGQTMLLEHRLSGLFLYECAVYTMRGQMAVCLWQLFARRVLGSTLGRCTASTPVSSSLEWHHFDGRSALYTSRFRRRRVIVPA